MPRFSHTRRERPRRVGCQETSDGFATYLTTIANQERLTWNQEQALIAAIARGDREAREQLIQANLRLVVTIARQFAGRGLPMEDLIGEGNLGLLRAIERFDPAVGVRFATYAGHWIRSAIRHALKTTTPVIRVPEHLFDLLVKWRRLERRLCRDGECLETADRVAQTLGLTAAQRRLVDLAMAAGSLQHADAGDAATRAVREPVDTRVDPPHLPLEEAEERTRIAAWVEQLEESERAILTLRFGLSGEPRMTLKQVGERLGLPRTLLRKMEEQALARVGEIFTRHDPDGPSPVRRIRRDQPGRRTRADGPSPKSSPKVAQRRRARKSPTTVVPAVDTALATVPTPPSTAVRTTNPNR